MKKLILFLALLLCSVPALATDINISGFQSPTQYRYSDSTVTLRIYSSDTFTTSDGKTVVANNPGGSWYFSTTCTAASNVLTCQSFTLPSTSDSSKPSAGYTGLIYDARGNQKETLFTKWRLGKTLTAITYKEWEAYQPKSSPPLGDSYYTKAQIDAKHAALQLAPLMTDGLAGRGRLSKPADNVSDPIVVGKNDYSSTTNLGLARISIAPVTASLPIAAGDNDPRLAAGSTSNRGTVTTTTSTSEVVSTDDPRLTATAALVFNVKDPAYGAIGNGVADDTAAILAAKNALQIAGGGKLYFPHGRYLISGSGTEIILFTKSATVEGEDKTTVLVHKSTNANTVYALRYKPATSGDSTGFQVRNLWIQAQSGTPGAGIALDATNAYIADFKIENVIVSTLGGKGLTLTNPLHATDGIFLGTIADSKFGSGILFDWAGDSIHFVRNNLYGSGNADITLVGGAAMLDFSHNNITLDGGVIFRGAKKIRFVHNQVELQAATNTGSEGSMINFKGDVAGIFQADISNNLFQGGGAAPSLHGILLGNQTGSVINSNTFSLPAGKSLVDVSALSGVFLLNNSTASGVSTATLNNPFAIQQYAYPFLNSNSPAITEFMGYIWLQNLKVTAFVSTVSSALANPSTANQFVSSVNTGTAPFLITSTTPVANLSAGPTTYNAAGTQRATVHIIMDTVALVAGTATVTFTGAAVFTSTSSFNCLAKSQAGGNVQETKNSGSSVTFTGTSTQQIDYLCVGN